MYDGAWQFDGPGLFSKDSLTGIALGDRYLGDIAICPAYVNKVMINDAANQLISAKDVANESRSDKTLTPEQALALLRDEDAGVSKAMANIESVHERIMLLLVHGLLHLMG